MSEATMTVVGAVSLCCGIYMLTDLVRHIDDRAAEVSILYLLLGLLGVGTGLGFLIPVGFGS